MCLLKRFDAVVSSYMTLMPWALSGSCASVISAKHYPGVRWGKIGTVTFFSWVSLARVCVTWKKVTGHDFLGWGPFRVGVLSWGLGIAWGLVMVRERRTDLSAIRGRWSGFQPRLGFSLNSIAVGSGSYGSVRLFMRPYFLRRDT